MRALSSVCTRSVYIVTDLDQEVASLSETYKKLSKNQPFCCIHTMKILHDLSKQETQ
jgi:hypothetical protein